jgi:protein transport protein SEC9
MFAVHVANPFTSKQRQMARDQKILDDHQRDREARDTSRKAAWDSQARQQEFARSDRQGPGAGGMKKSSLAERTKYQFEADSDDDRLEDEIDGNLDALHGAAGRLKNLSLAMGKEVDSQNKHIDRIIKKTDDVDDQIAMVSIQISHDCKIK